MRKIFATKKAKRKPGDFKVPVPMVGGIHNAKLSAAELDVILTGGQEPSGNRKPVSSVSTGTRHSHQHPIPARPISSPPTLSMPKPRRPVRQVELLLQGQDFDKTQIESSSESEEAQLHEEEEQESLVDIDASILVLWPENWTDKGGLAHPRADVPLLSNKLQRQQLLAAPDEPHERFEELSLLQDPPPAPAEHPIDLVSQQQSAVVSVTSSSEDSNLQYDSARQSPLLSVSSDQTPDNTSMDLLKKQLSQASSDQQKPTRIMTNALLIDDDEQDPISVQPQQPSPDASTPRLPKDVSQKLTALSNKVPTAESSSTSSNTVSPLLHAKITSTAVYPLPVPDLPSVAAPATMNVTPAHQKRQFPRQCDDNERSPVVVASRPEVPSSVSQEQRPGKDSFSLSLEALKRQVDLMQMQRQAEHQQWEQREMEHREREKIMLDKIRETQIQLEQALTQQLLTMTASDDMNGGDTATAQRPRQFSRPSSRKGKETRNENGEPFHFSDQDDSPSRDSKRDQQLRPAIRLRSRSSEMPRSAAYWDKRKDRETWKSSGTIRQQQAPPQTKESYSHTTFVDPIRGSQGQLNVGRRSHNEDGFFDKEWWSQNVIANQRHQQLQAHDDTDTSTSPDDSRTAIMGGRRSQAGPASSVLLYAKNSAENSPHGSNVSAKSDASMYNRRNRKGAGRSSSQERRRRSRSYSAPESPQDYHSALEDEEYEEALHSYSNTTHASQKNLQRPADHYHATERQDRWSKSPSSSTTRRHSPSMYEQPRSARLAAHMGFLPHQPVPHRNRRRRNSQRMMDEALLDEEMYHAYLVGLPPPMAHLPRGMHPPPPPPPPPGMTYHDDWPAGLPPGVWPPSIYRAGPPSSFSSSGKDSYQEPSNMMEGGQPGLFRPYSNRGAGGSNGGGPPSQQQTFPGGGLRQARMHPAMYQHPAAMDGPPSMGFR